MLRVVQCWDDAVNDDIALIEILRKHGAKASFNVNPATHHSERSGGYNTKYEKVIARLALSELKGVYEGFTIANHSMTHPRTLEISPEAWQREVVDARKWLQDFFQQPVLGFAYPFGHYDERSAQTVGEAGHVYARTTRNATPCLPVENPMMFHADCHFLNENFWTLYERAKQSEAGVFYFWGHSYEMNTPQMWSDFDACVRKISEDKDAVWCELPELFTGERGGR